MTSLPVPHNDYRRVPASKFDPNRDADAMPCYTGGHDYGRLESEKHLEPKRAEKVVVGAITPKHWKEFYVGNRSVWFHGFGYLKQHLSQLHVDPEQISSLAPVIKDGKEWRYKPWPILQMQMQTPAIIQLQYLVQDYVRLSHEYAPALFHFPDKKPVHKIKVIPFSLKKHPVIRGTVTEGGQTVLPYNTMHGDFNEETAHRILREVGGITDPTKRFRILSAWRPLRDDADIRAADVRLALQNTHEHHLLYSMVHQKLEDLLFLELWNSDKRRGVIHGAIKIEDDPLTDTTATHSSTEVRLLLIDEED